MAFGQYAQLDMHRPVTLTKQEVENNLPPEDKDEYEAAPMQEVGDNPVLLFHKPDNTLGSPKPETGPDQAETALQEFYKTLSPRLKKVVAANGSTQKQKRKKPNRAALKTAHAPKPAQAATKSVASEPLEKIVEHYQELNETNIVPLLPHAINMKKRRRSSLKMLHTAGAVIEDMPRLERTYQAKLHNIILIAEMLKLAA